MNYDAYVDHHVVKVEIYGELLLPKGNSFIRSLIF